MALEGRLRDLALSDVFQLLELSRKSGALTVWSELGDPPVTLHFDRGAITAAESPDRASEAPDPVHGVAEVAAGLLQWADGRFRFEEESSGRDAGTGVRIPAHAVLIEAARRADVAGTAAPAGPAARGAPDPPATDAIPRLADGLLGPAALDLEPAEWALLGAIDGVRTLREASAAAGLADGAAAAALAGLQRNRLVELLPRQRAHTGAAGADSTEEPLQEAERLLRQGAAVHARARIEALVAREPDGAPGRILLGRLLLLEGRARDAAEQLALAVRLDPLSADAHFHHGQAAVRTGDLEGAARSWTTFLRLPGTPAARAQRVRRAVEGLDALQALLDAGPT